MDCSRYLRHSKFLLIFFILQQNIDQSFEIGDCVSSQFNGTTKNLEQIMLGRCYEFLNVLHKDDCTFDRSKYDCAKIWASFKSVSVNKNPCDIKLSDYDQFLSLTDHTIGENATLFWSGTYTPAHEITKFYQYWSLEDTFAGFLLNNLRFCSVANKLDFDYDSCPVKCGIKDVVFWYAASAKFASKASGYLTIVLNGSRSSGAVSNTSTFFLYELPNLNPAKVKSLKVLLLHTPGQTQYETCKSPKSLVLMQNALKEKNITYQCEDNPNNILAFMCFQDPFSKEFQAILYSLNTGPSNMSNSLFILISCSFFFFLKKFLNYL